MLKIHMKYANFKDTGRTSVNIGDYLQFMAAERLLRQAERVRERRERSAGAERGKTPGPGKKKRKQ